MSTIITRSSKNKAMTFQEMDANLTNLNTDKEEISNKGAANGYAPLDSSSLVPAVNSRVQSVAGKTGAVTLVTADVSGAAPLASPTFTGTVAAPTPSVGDNTTKIATTAYANSLTRGYLAISVAGGVDVTLSSSQHGKALLNFTGALTANINVIFPAISGTWTVKNSTTGAYTITCKTASGTGVLLTQGTSNAIWGDATNIYEDQTDFTDTTLRGTPTAPTATAGTNSTQVATTAFVLGQAATVNPLMDGTAAVGTSLLYARQDHVHASDTSRAPLASPALTGTPTAPTATAGTNTTQVATTAFTTTATRGGTSMSVAGGVDVTLPQSVYSLPIITLTGAITANINVVFPAQTGMWVVRNNTTGSYTITCKTSAGTGVLVTQGKSNAIFGDATNIYAEQSDWQNLSGNVIISSGNISVGTIGNGLLVKEGSNAKQGTAVLSAGSVVVSNTSVTANSRIFLTSQVDGGTPGFLRVSTRTAGTSFTITSSSSSDTSTVAYEIFEPA